MVSTDPQIKVSHSQFELIHNRQALTLTPRGGDRVCDSNPEDSPQAADLESCTQTHTRTQARVRAHEHTHTHTHIHVYNRELLLFTSHVKGKAPLRHGARPRPHDRYPEHIPPSSLATSRVSAAVAESWLPGSTMSVILRPPIACLIAPHCYRSILNIRGRWGHTRTGSSAQSWVRYQCFAIHVLPSHSAPSSAPIRFTSGSRRVFLFLFFWVSLHPDPKVCSMSVERSRALLMLVVFAGSCFSVDGSAPLPISSADSLEAVRLPTSDGDGAMLPIRIPDVSTLQRTFLCVGPVCLRSGVGLMVGLGCGAGVGVGMGFPVTAQGGSFDSVGRSPLGQLLTQVPGGYTAIDLIRKVLARFPTSRIGVGCGIGW